MNISQSAGSCAITLGKSELARFTAPLIAGTSKPTLDISDAGYGWKRVRIEWNLAEPTQQDEVAVPFDLSFNPDFWWGPHLAPEDGNCIAQHVFRSPALIVSHGPATLVLAPDLDLCGQVESAPWFMDVDVPGNRLTLGLTRTEVETHVIYKKKPGMELPAGKLEFGFFVLAYADDDVPRNPFGRVSRMLWDRYGSPLLEKGEPGTVPMDRFVDHTYNWAFNTWRNPVWQEFELDGKKVGSPCFIVNVTQSPNYSGIPTWRENLSIWNQAWFASLRAAAGVLRYARRTQDANLEQKAMLTKEFSLSAPQREGLFPAVYAAEMADEEKDGKKIRTTKGWSTGHWTNSNRVPWERGITPEWYHVLDASWTCLHMLRWYRELDADLRLLTYATAYADRLLTLQDGQGFFPAWLDPKTFAPSPVLAQSPETSMSVTFLLELALITGEKKYHDAAIRAMDALLVEVVPAGRWEDFETYWSCCGWGKQEYFGKRIPRNGMYKQCNFSMFWTAEALLAAYRATGEARYLDWGRRVLDELSMTQQVWQPPFIHIPALGGFGVMNCDGEWNDARQSLFAELFLDYYREMGEPHLFERGIAALKASFVMMYCPENPQQKTLWEKVWPFFGPAEYGFMMENYGHGGETDREGLGIGEFTIYTWGNGAAAEARNRIRDHYGDVYIDRKRGHAFGIDSVRIEPRDGGFRVTDLAGAARDIRIVYENGSNQIVKLSNSVDL